VVLPIHQPPRYMNTGHSTSDFPPWRSIKTENLRLRLLARYWADWRNTKPLHHGWFR
jgi:hypothetical protein